MASGLNIGPYRAHTRLGVGGMAEVWLASRTGPQSFVKDYVVKRILPHLAADPKFVQLFLNEARLAARVNHANVAHVFELGEDNGDFYIVMEHVDGRSLRELLHVFRDRGLKLPVAVALYIAARACEGLHHAHETRGDDGAPLGLVHRDVSPENILLSFDGQVKLVDFGVARATTVAEHIQASTLAGKLPYMAPEQATGLGIDRRVDVYALGVTLYEMLAGRRPFAADNPNDLLQAILDRDATTLVRYRDDVREPVESLVRCALAKDREKRFEDARRFGVEIETCLREEAHVGAADLAAIMQRSFPRAAKRAARRMTAPTKAQPGAVRQRRPWRRGAAAAAATVVLGVTVALTARFDEPAPLPTAAAAPAPATRDVEPAAAPAVARASPAPLSTPRPRPAKVAEHQEKARLDVRVRPWGDVIVDEQAIGVTPIEPVEVLPGKHRVVAVNASLNRRKVVNVEARAGKSTIVEIDLTK